MKFAEYQRIFRLLCWIAVCSCPLLAASSQEAATPVSPAPVQQTSSNMGMAMGLVAPLVIESSDWNSVLTLVNESKTAVHAQIVMHTTEDMMSPAPAQTVTLPGHSSRRLAVETFLGNAAPDFIGSLMVNIQEPDAAKNMAVAAQLTLVGQGKLAGASIDEELEMPAMGSNFKSVAEGSSGLLAIQNSGMDSATANVTCLEHGVATHATVQIPANGLRILHGCELLDGSVISAAHVLSRAIAREPDLANGNHSGEGSAYEVSAGSSELSVFGLSASFKHERLRVSAAMFVNTSEFTSQSTVFAGIPVGSYSALPGTAFVPRLTVANLSNVSHAVIVKGALSDSASVPKVLSTVTLHPFEVKRLEVAFDATESSALGSLIVEQDGVLGDVISTLADSDTAGQTSLVPLPKFLHHANNGGGHPWSVEPGTSSSVVVFNASAKAQILNFNLVSCL